ncbi:hypothetical protein TNCV_2667921 [Trichonephila clavipes]|nr:hypothetical protein TNCV_2667921 [Trichonephila clavipes]
MGPFRSNTVFRSTVPKQSITYSANSHWILIDPDGRGYELVSSVRALVPHKFSVEEELMHVKHVDVKSPHVGVMWKFGRGVISSGISSLNRGSKLRSRSSVATVLT